MNVLGIWDGHDAGAALVVDGRLAAAVNEERLTRRKLEPHFPSRAIACCLQVAGLQPGDVHTACASTSDVARALGRWFPSLKESHYQIRRRKAPPGHLANITRRAKYTVTEWGPNRVSRALGRRALERELARVAIRPSEIRLLDHHDCHASAAAWTSGFARCAVVTIDGVGDGLSSTISRFDDGRLTRVAASPASQSLGILFEHVTNLLNMRELEDEGKVMALADYAAPVPDDRNSILQMFDVREGQTVAVRPGRAMLPYLRRIQWGYPNEQLAQMAQRTVEAVCSRLALDAVRLTGLSHVALGGGVVSNVKANRRVRLLPEVDGVFVFPHMGDGGLAVGAALAAVESPDRDAWRWSDLGFGPGYPDTAIADALSQTGLVPTKPAELGARVADLLVEGRIVLWFQGRMEYGPRALGHRSVLARPDRVDLRDRLNLILKQRVWYQPFCPSMLDTDAVRLLSDYAGPPNRHMTMAFMTAPDARQALAGVISVDGTCRPQMVSDAAKDPFADLLRAMKARTGYGVVLNTSLNVHGEPLACAPADAIDIFRRTHADALAIGPFLVSRAG